MGQGTKASLVGNNRIRNINNFQGQWVCKSRIRVSVPVSHVTQISRTHSAALLRFTCTSTYTWCELANSMLDQSLQLQIPNATVKLQPLQTSTDLALNSILKQGSGHPKGWASARPVWQYQRGHEFTPTLLSNLSLGQGWGTVKREEQTIASYQERKAWLFHKYLARRAWSGKYYLTGRGIQHILIQSFTGMAT